MTEKFYKQNTLPSLQDEPLHDAPLPERIGPYKIETLLTKGGMSLLYLGFDPETKEPRVIKVLSPQYLDHPEMVDHFLWEAKIIQLTDHPNIVKLYDHGKWEQGLYIAMEWIRGVSLRQFLMQQSFSLKRCIDITLQVAYALTHLHAHGVIHRDLKPENILIAEDGEVKVIDFGIAQLHDEKPKLQGQVVGTPSYMSPEQKENGAHASFASDIFSLGVICYELILGKLSYGMINLALLPPGLQTILGKALAISVSERYQDVVAFIHDLTEYMSSSELEKERPSTDLFVEIREKLRSAEKALSLQKPPAWPEFSIGIADHNPHGKHGHYFEAFRFNNHTFALIQAQTKSQDVKSALHISTLRGMIHTLIHPHLYTDVPLDPLEFATTLNTLVAQDSMDEVFHLQLLKLIPYTDTLVYLSAGKQAPLLHVPQGGKRPREIVSDNPLIGTTGGTYADAEDTFNEGDLLVMHTLPNSPFGPQIEKELSLNLLLSPTRIGKKILESFEESTEFQSLNHAQQIISLQRVG